jgi:hypothetical protein
MSRGAPRQVVILIAALCCAALTVAVSRALSARSARRYAERSAIGIAAYLSLVTRPLGDRSDYDLGQLLVRTRAVDLIPEWASQVEVYRGTAPLVHATAGALPPSTLDRLRRLETVEWRPGDVLVPLTDPDHWDVVGAVVVRVPVLGPRWFSGWGTPAFVVLLAAVAAYTRVSTRGERARRRALAYYWVAAFALAIGAVRDMVWTERHGTERWLAATRTLVQEAARGPAHPSLADLAPLAWGGTLTSRDSSALEPRDARTTVRLGSGRWAELRSTDPEAKAPVLCLLVLALLGPALVSVGALPRAAPSGGVSAS